MNWRWQNKPKQTTSSHVSNIPIWMSGGWILYVLHLSAFAAVLANLSAMLFVSALTPHSWVKESAKEKHMAEVELFQLCEWQHAEIINSADIQLDFVKGCKEIQPKHLSFHPEYKHLCEFLFSARYYPCRSKSTLTITFNSLYTALLPQSHPDKIQTNPEPHMLF